MHSARLGWSQTDMFSVFTCLFGSPWTTTSSSQLRRRTLVRTMRGPKLPRGPNGIPCFCASDFAFSDLQSFASQHCPIFYLHPEEEYFPSSFEEFIEHCQLYFHYDPVLTKVTPASMLKHTGKLAVSIPPMQLQQESLCM